MEYRDRPKGRSCAFLQSHAFVVSRITVQFTPVAMAATRMVRSSPKSKRPSSSRSSGPRTLTNLAESSFWPVNDSILVCSIANGGRSLPCA